MYQSYPIPNNPNHILPPKPAHIAQRLQLDLTLNKCLPFFYGLGASKRSLVSGVINSKVEFDILKRKNVNYFL